MLTCFALSSALVVSGLALVDADGTATRTNQPPFGRIYQWRYNGSADLAGAASATLAVGVRPTLTASVTKTVLRLRQGVLVYGGVVPRHPGQPVYLQRLVNGRWTHVATARLTGNSTCRFTLRPAVRGTYVYRTVRPSDTDHALAIRPSRTFLVR